MDGQGTLASKHHPPATGLRIEKYPCSIHCHDRRKEHKTCRNKVAFSASF